MKISILTPAYNAEKTIDYAIQSVMRQDYHDVEHIVVDGGSTDGTVSILEKYDHLKWISEPDEGQSDAMNKAFKMSKGEIVAYLNADDFYSKGIFKKVVETFKRTNCDILVGRYIKSFREVEYVVDPPVSFFAIVHHYWKGFPGNPISYFYKRFVQDRVGPFPLDNHYAMDYWFLLNSFGKFKKVKSKEIFGTYNRLPEAKTSKVNPVIVCKKTVVPILMKKHPFYLISYFLGWLIKFSIPHYSKLLFRQK